MQFSPLACGLCEELFKKLITTLKSNQPLIFICRYL
ncbi:hypothetical protein CDL12_22671 [Handroanthus impetiginosus]|uniref:Uncharacterized protein n=1 Tax=Handroanthus impetiginosus TaxID=429701 RepID=A0A2G9GHM9_9LAMI|nr:hypothetical protein CDL12_22671 [Handroanthus impetiginosus]